MILADIRSAVEGKGLAWRGAFHPRPSDNVPPLGGASPSATLVLLGFAGKIAWSSFIVSKEAAGGKDHPLDRWSRRIIDELATMTGALALYPVGGPPWHPFQGWAQRVEAVHVSPLCILIHPEWGLWHSYRGALAFQNHFELEPIEDQSSPCASCYTKPCMTACPVDAFAALGTEVFDAKSCNVHLESQIGGERLNIGFKARRACPIGAAYRYETDQAKYHRQAFRRS